MCCQWNYSAGRVSITVCLHERRRNFSDGTTVLLNQRYRCLGIRILRARPRTVLNKTWLNTFIFFHRSTFTEVFYFDRSALFSNFDYFCVYYVFGMYELLCRAFVR